MELSSPLGTTSRVPKEKTVSRSINTQKKNLANVQRFGLLASIIFYSEDPSPQWNLKMRTLAQWRFFADNFQGKKVEMSISLIVVAGLSPVGYSQKNWVGVRGPLSKTLTLFITKICDFPYPIYDQTKNSIPFLRPLRMKNHTF